MVEVHYSSGFHPLCTVRSNRYLIKGQEIVYDGLFPFMVHPRYWFRSLESRVAIATRIVEKRAAAQKAQAKADAALSQQLTEVAEKSQPGYRPPPF